MKSITWQIEFKKRNDSIVEAVIWEEDKEVKKFCITDYGCVKGKEQEALFLLKTDAFRYICKLVKEFQSKNKVVQTLVNNSAITCSYQ